MGRPLLGDRLLVRRPTPADRDEYSELLRASAEFHRPWFPEPAPDVEPFGDQAFARYLAGDDGVRGFRFLLTERETGAIVGAVNVNELVRGVFQSAYLGYWLGSAHTGCGYMREGLGLVIGHALMPEPDGGLGLHRVEANIIPENAASIAVVRALGFRCEGLSPRYLKIAGSWRDHERWALTVEDLAG